MRVERGIKALLEGMQRTLGWDPIIDAGHVIGLVEPTGQGAISLEPGGQFELSGAPLETIHQTCREGNAHLAQLREIAEPLGIRFLGFGGSPKWTLAETPRMPKSRYDIMTNYMPKVGTQGLDMMYRTCTIQVNLDFSSRSRHAAQDGGLDAAAAARDRAFRQLALHRRQAERAPVLARRHLARHGQPALGSMLPFVYSDRFGFADYVEWALDVPMYFLIRDGRYHDVTHVTFRQFMARFAQGRGTPGPSDHGRLGEPPVNALPRRSPQALPRDARRRWRPVAAHLRAARLLGRASL
jgi:glutamate--cysteine ligase